MRQPTRPESPLRARVRKIKGKHSEPCMVFALCDRPATTTTPHSILGDVPACQRCADRMQELAR